MGATLLTKLTKPYDGKELMMIKAHSKPSENLIGLAAAAELTGLGRRVLRTGIAKEQIPHIWVGYRVYILKRQLLELIGVGAIQDKRRTYSREYQIDELDRFNKRQDLASLREVLHGETWQEREDRLFEPEAGEVPRERMFDDE